jgi:hypothetical protein
MSSQNSAWRPAFYIVVPDKSIHVGRGKKTACAIKREFHREIVSFFPYVSIAAARREIPKAELPISAPGNQYSIVVDESK